MPTTNPVPSTDPTDLLFNAGKLDEVVNGIANSFTDRLGATRRTVSGMNADFDAQLADAESDLNIYRADAAASAAEALGYLQTIRATSYGAYAEDPTTDPLGNPPTVGDEYFNTTANLLKRWNGTTWQASDINTANLAASSGSSLVGYDGGTVQDVLDGAKSLQDYAALRAYTGRAKRVYITGQLVTAKPAGIAGVFQYDPTDTTSADNGATIIVGADGRRWKRDYVGDVMVDWSGAAGDGVTDDSEKIQSVIDSLTAIYAAKKRPQTIRFTDGKTYMCHLVYMKPGVNYVADGSATILKKPAGSETNETVMRFWRVFTTNPSDWNNQALCDHRVSIKGLVFDGNLENMNWTFMSYNQEQAHCIFVTGPQNANAVSKYHKSKFLIKSCKFRNSVANAIAQYNNCDLMVEDVEAENCFRAGIGGSGGNSIILVKNYIGDGARIDFEVDAIGYGSSYRYDIYINDAKTDKTNDLFVGGAGIDIGDTGYDSIIRVKNFIGLKGPFNFYQGSDNTIVEDSYFELSGRTGVANRFIRGIGKFKNSEFKSMLETGVTNYSAVHLYQNSVPVNKELLFDSCKFTLDSNIKLAATETWSLQAVRLEASDTTDKNYRIRLKNCESSGGWNQDLCVVTGGNVEISNPIIDSATIIQSTQSASRPVSIRLTGEFILSDSVTKMFYLTPQANQTGTQLSFQNVTLSKYVPCGGDGYINTYSVSGNYKFNIDAAPVSGVSAIRGAVAAKNNLTASSGQFGAIEWTATSTSTTSSAWKVSKFESSRGTTANRPTLTSIDTGVAYFDTTLDADGKPIWWTGTAWVDATGIVV